jgi:hypothetical protein
MRNVGLRSPCDKVEGLVYFGRMLDKLRSHAKGELPPEYRANLGKGFDEKCVSFLRVKYDQIVAWGNAGMKDGEILQSCFAMRHRPSEDEIYMWNEFMRERGWNDEISERLKRRKREGMTARSEIETMFQFIDADEGRVPDTNHYGGSCLKARPNFGLTSSCLATCPWLS